MIFLARAVLRRGCLTACLAAIVSLCFRPCTAAETSSLSVRYLPRTWQVDEGLPDNNVQAVVQTHDHYIWVGTSKGLARFDGVAFKTFTPQNTPELHSADVTSLCEDNENNLWIGTDDGGITQFRQGRFTHFDLPGQDGANSVRTIFCSPRVPLLVGTMEGLFQFRNGSWNPYGTRDGADLGIVRAICEYKGQLWIGTGAGIATFKDGVCVTNQALPATVSQVAVRALVADTKGNLWAGMAGGLWVLHFGKWRAYSRPLADINLSTLLEDHQGELWIGTFGGLNRLSAGKILTEKDST
jgi:ligand-binding sensor domain-containing protein